MAKSQSYNILLVCQAGKQIGLGHLSRTLVAAKALHLNGHSSRLLLQGEAGLEQAFEDYISLSRIKLTQPLCENIRRLATVHCTLVIFDLHTLNVPKELPDLLIELRKRHILTIAIDALAEYHELLDLVYTPSFRPNGCLTEAQQKKSIYGWDSYLLKVSKDIVVNKTNAVLILTGGADTTKLGAYWLKELDEKLPTHLTLHWVRGPFATAPILPDDTKREIVIHDAPASLTVLMNKVSFAITLYGVSFFELLYYGVPTVVFSPYNHKDDEELAEVNEQKVALVAIDEHHAISQLTQLITSEQLANKLSENARAKLANADGNTISKCVESLLRKK